ncbi:MFS transporter [Nocardia vinacea]|uniref:MFS transporter n=1 Tax=Nocardia vinacea TaxID=96468 RepID=UPI002E0FC26C|nr:MFS transporter [Nocardia vinacea]
MSTIESTPAPDETGKSETGRMDGASRLRIAAVLAVIILYTEVGPLQYTMVVAALQPMTTTFDTVGGNITWALIILGLVGVAANPLLGKASDIWGKKKIMLLCGTLFLIGSVICALTSNWTVFLIGRGLSAFALATQVIAFGLVRDLLPRKYVPIGLALIGTGVGFTGVVGPLVGGLLADSFGWRALFWFMAVFVLVLTPLLLVVVPESPVRWPERVDPYGVILLAAGAVLTLLYLDNGQDWGWVSPTGVAWLIAGLVLLMLFFIVESRVKRPIIDMKLILDPKLGLVLLMAIFSIGITAVQPMALGYMTQSPNEDGLRQTMVDGVVGQAQASGANLSAAAIDITFDPGYSYGNGFSLLEYALHIGIWASLIGMFVGPFAGLLTRRVGARIPAIIALALLSMSGLGFVVADYSWVTYLVLYVVAGVAFGFLWAALPNLIVEAVPPEQQGISSGMLGVTLALGTGVAMAISTAALNNSPVVAHIDVAGDSSTGAVPQVFADNGYTQSFWFVLVTTVIALVIAVLMRHGRKPATGGVNSTG